MLFCLPCRLHESRMKKKVDYRLHTATTAAVAVDFIKVNSMSGSVFSVTANGYGSLGHSFSLRFSTARPYGSGQCGPVCLTVCAVCVLHFHLSLLDVFTPATKS